MDCLSEDVVLDLLEGRLDAEHLDRVSAHLDECGACSALVGGAGRAIDSGPALPVQGTVIGRFVVLGAIGSGSMGTVFAAYDPELDRKVALKMLRVDALAPRPRAELRDRLVREAHALAKLSHPNVVHVYDVVRMGEEIFLAMELVEGPALLEWLHARKRSIREIVAMFAEAGAGLAAAHSAGIVHRDFKPQNVLVGPDGRARVGDFGLARVTHAEQPGASATGFTEQTSLAGTPAYMAPEQWDGAPADARTDVFGFSVALFEALYGERPFGDDDLRARMQREEIADPRSARVPSWLRAVVVRGLRSKPEERWQTMRAMLEALGKGPTITLGRVLGVAFIVSVIAFLTIAARRPDTRCTGADEAYGNVWTAARKDAVRTAFLRTNRPSAERAFAEIDRAFEALRPKWIAMRTDACAATRFRGEQSEALLDLRVSCLDERKNEAIALADVLAKADANTVDHWANAVSALSVDRCANGKALLGPSPLPRTPEADRLSSDLSRARALYWTGKYRDARDAATAVVRDAHGVTLLEARALLVNGDAEQRLGELDAANKHLHEAATLGMIARDDATVADAWILLVRVDGSLRGHRDDAVRWARYAEAALARLGGDDEREATRLRNLATVERGVGTVEQGPIDLLLRARALYEKSAEPARSYYISNVDETLAAAFYLSGRMTEALARYHETEVTRTRLFGPVHPAVAAALGNEADCLLALGRLDEALADWNKVIEILGPRPWPRSGRASVLRKLGRFADALDDDTHAIDDEKSSDGAELADALTGRGLDLLALNRAVEAVPPLERALAIREAGIHRVDLVATTRFALARALSDHARAAELASQAERALMPLATAYGSFFAEELAEIRAWQATR